MSEKELKPCPFCGEAAKLEVIDNEFYYVSCENCGSSTSFGKVFEDGTATDSTEAETLAAWNNRNDSINSQGWISVNDKLPDEEQDVLVLVREIEFYGRHKEKREVWRSIYTGWHVDGEWATTYVFGHKHIQMEEDDRCELTVTHWMPLPELPEKGG